MEPLKKKLAKNIFCLKCYDMINKVMFDVFSLDEYFIKRSFKKYLKYNLDLKNPKTLNEKIQWLKLNKRDTFSTLCVDKYMARKYFEKEFGPNGLIPLDFQTYDWRDIKPENMPNHPFVIKANHGSGMNIIIRNKNKVNWKEIQHKCREWLNKNYYYRGLEWQYKNVRPCILVEKLLMDKSGKLPNDYKLHYLNGKLEFVYCSIDRENENHRNIYSPDWKPLPFSWVAEQDHRQNLVGLEIKKPTSFKKMVKIGNEIAKNFDLVRVDFYDVDGKLYYGEITLHHGGGFNTFKPKKYDLIYGKKLNIFI